MLKDLLITNVQPTDYKDQYGNVSYNVYVDGVKELITTKSKWVLDQVGKLTTFEVTKKTGKSGSPYYTLTKPAPTTSTGSTQPMQFVVQSSSPEARDESICRQVSAKVVGYLYQGRGMDKETFEREATYILDWILNRSTAKSDGKLEPSEEQETTELVREVIETPTDKINLDDIPF